MLVLLVVEEGEREESQEGKNKVFAVGTNIVFSQTMA